MESTSRALDEFLKLLYSTEGIGEDCPINLLQSRFLSATKNPKRFQHRDIAKYVIDVFEEGSLPPQFNGDVLVDSMLCFRGASLKQCETLLLYHSVNRNVPHSVRKQAVLRTISQQGLPKGILEKLRIELNNILASEGG